LELYGRRLTSGEWETLESKMKFFESLTEARETQRAWVELEDAVRERMPYARSGHYSMLRDLYRSSTHNCCRR
jgi:hypothetical protein